MKKHQVRIVGGEYRRTPIPVANVEHLRPTPDRMRETLFNWLSHFWDGEFGDKRVLDLFAGTGALGFEAASRGAAHVQLVENAPAALSGLHALKSRLGAEHIHIQAGDAIAFLQARHVPAYDLVLLDPPFHHGWLERIWPLLDHVLRPNGLVYVESERMPDETPSCLSLLRQTRAGRVHGRLLQFAAMQKTLNNPESRRPSSGSGSPAHDHDTETP